MYIVFIRNYRIKFILAFTIFLMGILILLFSHYILHNNLAIKVTINDYFSFSHPISFKVNNVLINEALEEEAFKSNRSIRKLTEQNFINFENLEGKFSFKYPSSFTLAQKQFSGSDILYHIDFQNQSLDTHGFIQIWNLPYSLKDFLSESESSSQFNHDQFASKPIEVNGLPGYLWNYSFQGNKEIYYKGLEVFLTKGERMYRISYFVSENKWNESHSEIFGNMVKSFKTY